MRGTLSIFATAAFASMAIAATSVAADKEKDEVVTLWLPGNATLTTATSHLVVLGRGTGKLKLPKGCVGNNAAVHTWNMLGVDATGGTIITIGASSDVKQSTKKLTSLRAEGECKDAKSTWRKYSAVAEKAKPVAGGNPATAATPTPKPKDEKKKDDKKKGN